MKSDSAKHRTEVVKRIKSLITGVTAGAVVSVIAVILTAFAVMKSGSVPYDTMPALAAASGCLGAFAGGYLCARINKSMGLAMGAACGGLLFLVLLIAGLGFGGGIGLFTLVRALLMAVCGGIGGILGVNRRKRRK